MTDTRTPLSSPALALTMLRDIADEQDSTTRGQLLLIADTLDDARTPATPDALREALVEALRTAHRPHQPTCAYDRYPGNYAEPPDPCTCGLDDLMDRALNGPGLSAEGGR